MALSHATTLSERLSLFFGKCVGGVLTRKARDIFTRDNPEGIIVMCSKKSSIFLTKT